MAITLVQSNGGLATGVATANTPAWGTPTTAGNLLVVVVNETRTGPNGGWAPNPPSGYTSAPFTEFAYSTAATSGNYGVFYAIAAGSDATPGNTSDSGSADWQVYTYEFACTTGWNATPIDAEAHSAATAALATSSASGSTATLAQASELAIAIFGGSVAVTALTFSGGYTNAQPATNNGRLWVGWQEVSATTALSTTASWTTSSVPGARILTFKTAAAASPTSPRPFASWTVHAGGA